jgi:hypothetical protein
MIKRFLSDLAINITLVSFAIGHHRRRNSPRRSAEK